MTERRAKRPNTVSFPSNRQATIRAVREVLQQTEELAASANMTETAFLIGVALASLSEEPNADRANEHSIDVCLPGVH